MVHLSKRKWVAVAAAAAAVMGMGAVVPAMAQPKEVKVALIAPLSGPWARNGDMMRKGAEMAVEDINNAGGIKALGGCHGFLAVLFHLGHHRGNGTRRAAHVDLVVCGQHHRTWV